MIYKAFEQSDIVSGRATKVSTGFFADGALTALQSSFVSSSTQETISGSNRFDIYNGYYYLDVFPDSSNTTSADQIFSIAYGNVNGYGTSADEYTNVQVHPTQAVWRQYVNELNGAQSFSVKSQSSVNGTVSSISLSTDFVALSFNSQKTKDTLDAGQFQLTLQTSGSGGTAKLWRIIDDSSLTTQSGSSDVYNLILGEYDSNGTATYWSSSAAGPGTTNGGLTTGLNYVGTASQAQYYPAVGSYSGGIGLLYPKSGVVIFNVDFLSVISNSGPVGIVIPILSDAVGAGSGNYRAYAPTADALINKNNRIKTAVYQMLISTECVAGEKLRIRRSEYVPSRHYFVRIKNREFNYTNNPTFSYQTATTDTSGNFHQKGDIIQTDFLTEPKVYPTSVGLYNSNNELVAVAKLSNPAQKTFTNELLVKVRLDF
jgi:hypothetical protein